MEIKAPSVEEKAYQHHLSVAATEQTILPKWEDIYEDYERDYIATAETIERMDKEERKSNAFFIVFILCIAAAAALIIYIHNNY